MKKIFFSALLISTFGILAFSIKNDEPLPIGSPLPKADTKMKDITGKEVSMKETMKENGLLVMFSCNTCPWVIRNQGRTHEICQYAFGNNIGVILINSNEGQRSDDDSFNAMQEYAKAQGYKWYYVVDKNNEV